MSRPRKPYGPNPPGRLLATMVKVLAAESSDQSRLARGKRYWADDAVIDIVIGHGAVTAEVQGSRPEPYIVTIEAAGGEGVPSRRELWLRCTCPDDSGTGADACKHAVAAMFALSDEIAIDPTLIDRWRSGSRLARDDSASVTRLPLGRSRNDDADDIDDRDDDDDETGDDDDDVAEVVALHPEPTLDGLSVLLRAPDGATAAPLPDPPYLEHPPMRPAIVGEILDDALDNLAIRWE